MSTIQAGYGRTDHDHFRPQADNDPAAHRRLRGQLEAIDYTAFACNREVIGKALGRAPPGAFQDMALAAAHARAAWVAEAMLVARGGRTPTDEQVARLAALRQAYEELREAYEAARRMVERGYLPYETPNAS